VYRSLPRTAIIGAGISGLTAGKMLKDYGVPYTTFETSDRIGGNWAFGNPNGHSSAYRSLHIDTSRQRLCFKDFPMPEHYPTFPHHSDVKAYLDDLAFIGFAQSVPTLFPFVECQSRLLAAYAVGRYALPSHAEMERVIDAEHDLRTRELRASLERANRVAQV